MAPIRKGDGTGFTPKGFAGVRKGDGTILYSAEPVIPDSGVSRWTFDDADTNNGTALDVWGSNDGTINGATTGQSGANQTYTTNEAYDFDGENDYILVGDSNSLDFSDGLTFSVWGFIRGGTDREQTFLGKYDTDNDNRGYQFILNRSSVPNISLVLSNSSGDSFGGQQSSPNIYSTQEWNHFAATWGPNTNGGEPQLYVNGSEVSSYEETFQQTSNINTNPVDLNIGKSSYANGREVNGLIDDVRLYSVPLSSSEINNLYNTGSISG